MQSVLSSSSGYFLFIVSVPIVIDSSRECSHAAHSVRTVFTVKAFRRVQVLRARFPGVLLYPDIAAVPRLPEETQVVTGGFPCIDISRAGLQQGILLGLVRSPVGIQQHAVTVLFPPPRCGQSAARRAVGIAACVLASSQCRKPPAAFVVLCFRAIWLSR
jgi:hypothetical protein